MNLTLSCLLRENMYLFARLVLIAILISSHAHAKNKINSWPEAKRSIKILSNQSWLDLELESNVPIEILKRYNDIKKLKVGQRIEIPEKIIYQVKKGETALGIAVKFAMKFSEIIELNDLVQPYSLSVDQQIKLLNLRKVNKTIKLKNHKIAFIWPLKGKVINKFEINDINNHAGITILAQSNSAVSAVAAGEIVYTGNDIGSNGNMIIIDHQNDWLSNYSKLARIMVKEGDQVKTGQIIGYLGTVTPELFFGIRKEREPVNPLKYLPKHKNRG